MFQFRAFPPYTYLIQCTVPEYCSGVLPHSEISGSTLICSSPKLIAACHVLHRLLMPRHSPCALYSLTYVEENCVPLRPPLFERRTSASLRFLLLIASNPLALGFAARKGNVLFSSFWFSIKNYAGSTELLNKIVFTLLKKFHN